jgi:hypothetical protein
MYRKERRGQRNIVSNLKGNDSCGVYIVFEVRLSLGMPETDPIPEVSDGPVRKSSFLSCAEFRAVL